VIEPPAARQPPASNDGASSPATSSLRRLVRFVFPGGGGGGWHAHIDRMENQLLPVESKYQRRSILFFFSFFSWFIDPSYVHRTGSFLKRKENSLFLKFIIIMECH